MSNKKNRSGFLKNILIKLLLIQEQRAYGLSYDAVNRLTQADFTQYTSSTWNTNAGLDFSVSNLSFDANGNIFSPPGVFAWGDQRVSSPKINLQLLNKNN